MPAGSGSERKVPPAVFPTASAFPSASKSTMVQGAAVVPEALTVTRPKEARPTLKVPDLRVAEAVPEAA